MRVARADHYYTLTATLAARGSQVTTSRVVAAVIVGLGLIPMAVVRSSAAPQWALGRVLCVVITLGSLAMASVWLRHRWPTRMESAFCVATGAVLIAVACVLPSNPVYGLLGASSFALVAGYAALFHSLKLLAFTLTVAGATTVWLAVRVGADDLVLALAAVMLIVLLNVFSAFTCRLVVGLGGVMASAGEVEPLTGLPNRDSFYDMTATLVASRSRDDDRYLVIAIVNIDTFAAMVSMDGARGGARARISAGQALRETVRRDAIVGHIADAEFLIADSFTAPDPAPLIERVRSAIAATPFGMTASIGVVSTPLRPLVDRPPHDVLDELVAIATAEMFEARRAGGNQARYVTRPSLSAADDQDDPLDPL